MNVEFLSTAAIAIGLSADCFALALGSGISSRSLSWSTPLKVALSFGVVQAVLPVLGWLAGRTVVDLISGFDHWVAFALLGYVGSKMVFESFRRSESQKRSSDVTRGWTLLTLSVATSIDALAVGLSFAFLDINIAAAASTIGIASFAITMLGFFVGRKAGSIVGKRAELAGGVILVAIALRILLSHLL